MHAYNLSIPEAETGEFPVQLQMLSQKKKKKYNLCSFEEVSLEGFILKYNKSGFFIVNSFFLQHISVLSHFIMSLKKFSSAFNMEKPLLEH
jgi:hypothetical protein